MRQDQDFGDLVGDPNRRACHSIRGYFYQLWQAVDMWISLTPGEFLYVEGAEDIDIIRPGHSIAVQVKDTKGSGRLTLGSADALTALNNFWMLRQENSARSIKYKFVTTARVGLEKGGEKNKSLVEMWNTCRGASPEVRKAEIEIISKFLSSKKKLDSVFLKFLGEASCEVFSQELLEPFEWVFDQPQIDDIESIITQKLIERGQHLGITSDDADKLALKLLKIVSDLACLDTRKPVTLEDLQKEFDSIVNVTIPREALRSLAKFDKQLKPFEFGNSGFDEKIVPTLQGPAGQFLAPIVRPGTWPRMNLEGMLSTALESSVVCVFGSTGMGKTTLVRNVLNSETRPLWAEMRGDSDEGVTRKLNLLIGHLLEIQERFEVILDDLNPVGDGRAFEAILRRLISVIGIHGGKLIIISYKRPGPRLASVLGLHPSSTISVSPFSESDIAGILQAEGCPEKRAGNLKRYLWLQTSGHPALLVARVSVLKAESFPLPTADFVFKKPKEIQDAQAEALEIVAIVLPNSARNLLYRLSLASMSFQRVHALRIGKFEPAIPNAGESLNLLIGPWLEEVEEDRFRVSALVSGAGEKVLTPEDQKVIHQNIATAVLRGKSLDVRDFPGVVLNTMHGEAGEQWDLIAQIFITAPEDIKKMVADEIFWVAHFGIKSNTNLPVSSKVSRRLFRLFQLEVAACAAPFLLDDLVEAIEGEFEGKIEGLENILTRIMIITKLLLKPEIPLGLDRVISFLAEIWKYAEEMHDRGEGPDILNMSTRSASGGLERHMLCDLFTIAVIPRMQAVGDLDLLVDSIDSLDEKERNLILKGLQSDDGELRMLFGNPWQSIELSDRQGQVRYAASLNKAITIGQRWGNHLWQRAAARCLSAVYDEALGQSGDAKLIIQELSNDIGTSLNLEEQHAIIAYNAKDYPLALSIWNTVLPDWKSDELYNDTQPVFGARYAAKSAAFLNHWGEAAKLFELASSKAEHLQMQILRIGLLGDYAYALWMDGGQRKAVVVFEDILLALEKVPNRPELLREYALYKTVGHVLAYLYLGGDELATPPPGMCSDPNPKEEIKDLPVSPAAVSWHLLFKLAEANRSEDVARRCIEKMRGAPYVMVRTAVVRADVIDEIRNRNYKSVIKLAAELGVEFVRATKIASIQECSLSDPPGIDAELNQHVIDEIVIPILWLALLQARADEDCINQMMRPWVEALDESQQFLVRELDQILDFSLLPADDLAQIMRGKNSRFKDMMLAAVLLVGNTENSPMDELFAQLNIVGLVIRSDIFKDVAGDSMGVLVRRGWTRLVENRTLLEDPNIHVESIIAACNGGTFGWACVSRIILAALPTVRLGVPDETIQNLRDMQDSE